jgi:hypothetical protein
MTTASNKAPPNHELLSHIRKDMRVRKAGGRASYTPPSDASREEKMIHFFLWARVKFPRQACPLKYVSWVIDGGVKMVHENSKALDGLKMLLVNKRVQEALAKRNQRIFYVRGIGDDAGYRMNADDEDMAMTVLSSDKRRAKNAMHKAAQTYSMIDESKLLTEEAREHYGDVGAMAALLSQAGYLSLPDMSPESVKRLQAGIAKRRGKRTG